jgi:hypothetical protein
VIERCLREIGITRSRISTSAIDSTVRDEEWATA